MSGGCHEANSHITDNAVSLEGVQRLAKYLQEFATGSSS
jgi:hypothetical protein